MLRITTDTPQGAARTLFIALAALGATAVRADGPAAPAILASGDAVESRAQKAAPEGAPAAPPDGVKRVVYVPEIVKARLREEIKEEVLAQAKREGWAAPGHLPEWLDRFQLHGDIGGRWERSLFGRGNANDGSFPDFNAINTNKPFDGSGVDLANDRYLDVDQNRTRPRLRAHLEVDADVTRGFTAGVRLASGENGSPASTNQTLGASGGDFSKYPLWLDRAFIRYQPLQGNGSGLVFHVGRFENPFFATELVWSDNVNLDGVAVQAAAGKVFRPFLVAGAFPVYTTSFNFPPERSDKFPSRNRWLYASQVGAEWKPAQAFRVKLGAALYYFDKLEGRLSRSCDTHLKDVTCDTDDSRPPFAQKGNTYMPLRTPSDRAVAAEAAGVVPRYQFFGLAARFRELTATGRVELDLTPAVKVSFDGELVRNLGFSRNQVGQVALNNLDRCDASGNCERFAGGDQGYLGRLSFGSPTQAKRWDWNASVSYRHLESDAVVDAFNDPDFGLGGTNLKGVGFGLTLGLADDILASARWLSADAIVGPTYRVDVLQLDLLARF